MNYYLDHNIYIYSLKNESIVQAVENLKKNSVQFYYSPAHIEEIFKASIDNEDYYLKIGEKLLNQISKFTDNKEYLPSFMDIKIEEESPFECYKRVAENDTTKIICLNSKIMHEKIRNNCIKLANECKANKSISTIPFNEIWKHKLIISEISYINKNMAQIIEQDNKYTDDVCKLFNCILPKDLQIESGMYPKLKDSHKQIEFVISILFEILSFCGYNYDKDEKTALSGVHDVTHAIYATKSDKLFTVDKRFANRCKAVYYFLGVDTEVILCESSKVSEYLLEHI